ncbi:protein-glutamate O-methyltransferase [candidate division KSB1 bacterium]|nr:protein-glutamate O-methyltransferase [candidate division KSB1 bacterium]
MHLFGRTSGGDTAANLPLRDSDFKAICRLAYDTAGIHLTDAKRELVQARLGKRLRQLGLDSFDQYLRRLREDKTSAELISMLDALSTNLTSFWRESQHFDYLREHVLPPAFERIKAGADIRLRAWSAGCSTGEEPYGLTMVILDALPPNLRADIGILATDLSTRVLGIAKQGGYPETRVKDVPSAMRSRFFHLSRDRRDVIYQVTDEVRSRVKFARLNLMQNWPMHGPFDVILCRNVMIYFDKPTQAKLVGRYFDLLRPGGYLFIGHSESLTGIDHKYRYAEPTIYQKP